MGKVKTMLNQIATSFVPQGGDKGIEEDSILRS
jgi:hypothetical protein